MGESQQNILYGRGSLSFQLPSGVRPTVIRKPEMPILSDPHYAVVDALTNPTGNAGESESLAELARGSQSACIVICDITRPVPNHLFLRPAIELLVENGIPLDQVNILVATGLHRPNLGDELQELVRDTWVLKNVQIINHDARDDSAHVDLGRTATRSTPVKINKVFANADLRIVTGLVEPHFMAGFSGGRKVIAPGVAHADTIRTFHNHAFMSHPKSVNCNLNSNPLHEEQLEIVKMVGGACAINTVIDEERNLAFVNFGEVTVSHQEAVGVIRDYCRVPVANPFDVVITSAAGYPLDKTYYQAVKGMVGAMDILKPDGKLVIAAECSEGIGSPEYVRAQRKLTGEGIDKFLDSLKVKTFADIDEWQTQMQTKTMSRGSIHLFSSLSAEDHLLTGVHRIEDLNALVSRIRSDQSVAVIPEGPYVIPFWPRTLYQKADTIVCKEPVLLETW